MVLLAFIFIKYGFLYTLSGGGEAKFESLGDPHPSLRKFWGGLFFVVDMPG